MPYVYYTLTGVEKNRKCNQNMGVRQNEHLYLISQKIILKIMVTKEREK